MFGASSELASVMEFGFYRCSWTLAANPVHDGGPSDLCARMPSNSNNCSIYIAPPTSRPRAHHKASQPVLWCP